MDITYEIAALVALIGLSGYFSGLEVALVSIRPSKIEQLIKNKVKGASSLHKLKSNPSRMMSSVNLGNNLASIAATALATDIALKLFGDEGLAIAIGIMTFLILIFSEITPKTYCNANATKIAVRNSRILLVFSYAFFPIIWILSRQLVHNSPHILTKNASDLFENDDPKSTSFMMKSVFCAYTTRLRLVIIKIFFRIHQSQPTSISTK